MRFEFFPAPSARKKASLIMNEFGADFEHSLYFGIVKSHAGCFRILSAMREMSELRVRFFGDKGIS